MHTYPETGKTEKSIEPKFNQAEAAFLFNCESAQFCIRNENSLVRHRLVDYEHYILQGEAKPTEFSDDRSYLLVQKANSHCACVGQTEECCLPKIDEIDDFGSLLYSCLDRCVRCLVISTLLLPHLSKQKSFQVHQLFGPPDLIWSLHMCALCGDFKDWAFETSNLQKK